MTETPDVGEPAPMIPVVIVDDSEDVRILIGARLQSSGRFTVVGEAGDGASAVNVVAATAPRLVVLDLSMPGMSGLEAIPLIRAAGHGRTRRRTPANSQPPPPPCSSTVPTPQRHRP